MKSNLPAAAGNIERTLRLKMDQLSGEMLKTEPRSEIQEFTDQSTRATADIGRRLNRHNFLYSYLFGQPNRRCINIVLWQCMTNFLRGIRVRYRCSELC